MKINKIKYSQFFLGIIIFLFISAQSYAQNKAQDAPEDDEKVTLERADILEKTPDNPRVKKLKNRVVVKHKGTILYCDSAYLHEDKNAVDAFGAARLIGDNGTTLTADSMFYDGNTQRARAVGKKVVLTDEKMQLTTRNLDYDLATGVAYYYTGGKIVDTEKTLESNTGSYDTNSKIFRFQNNVKLVSNQDGRKIDTEDLTYNTISKFAYFQGPTYITSQDGKIYTESGNYNTESRISTFKGRTKLEDEEYMMEADSLYFDNTYKIGIAQRNVRLVSKKDSLIVEGDFAWYRGNDGESKIYGNVVAQNISNGDTLWLKADTMYAINRKNPDTKILYAYPNTKIYRADFQGHCDSLVYQRTDSTIYFYGDPVLWNGGNQLSADSIQIQLANNQLRTMTMRMNSFVISEDTLKNYNQLKGKNMDASFRENQIRKMEIRGNGQMIYFAVEKDTILVGMNRADCSDIDITFKEKNQLYRIKQITKVDAQFVPPHEIEEPLTKLKDFRWRIVEKPTRKEMVKRKEILAKENLQKKIQKNDDL
jgi:lipopolysaccharide export system protein LptA